MATTIFSPQITLPIPNHVCDSIKVPRETEITLSREVLEQNMLMTIPDDLCDFVKVPSGTKMSRTEIESFGKKFVRDNFDLIEASWQRLIFNKDRSFTDDEVTMLTKLFHLRALGKPETYALPDELCELLEIPIGLPMNRFDLENQVSEYIRVKKLMRGQIIHLRDAENLRKVFAISEDTEEISYSDLMMKIIAYFVEKVQFANTMKDTTFRNIVYKISRDEFADFLEVPHRTKMSIAEAVCRVAKYTFDNGLQVWDCKKNSFTPDEKLRNLLSLPEDDGKRMEITYEELQTHVTHNM